MDMELSSYLSRFHIPDNSRCKGCGPEKDDASHILISCTMVMEQQRVGRTSGCGYYGKDPSRPDAGRRVELAEDRGLHGPNNEDQTAPQHGF